MRRILLLLFVLLIGPARADWPEGGPAPEMRAADPVALARVRARLAEDPRANLADAEAEALLTATVSHVRVTLLRCGRDMVSPDITPEQFFSAETIAGFCELAEAAGTFVLEDFGLPRERAMRGQAGRLFGATAVRHAFLMVDAGGGRCWLLDPTFRQFFHPTENRRVRDIGFAGRLLLEQDGGRTFADEILRRGFAALSAERAAAYARALARDRGFRGSLEAMVAGREGSLEVNRLLFGSMLDRP